MRACMCTHAHNISNRHAHSGTHTTCRYVDEVIIGAAEQVGKLGKASA
jgi:hypothetical protein